MTTNREWLYSLDMADLSDWFDAEHVDANDDFAAENDISADNVDANDENATCNNSGDFVTHDSREKLEADVRQYANPSGGTGTLGACWEKKMLEFLDRQDEITRDETIRTYNIAAREARKVQENRIADLEEEIAKRDKGIARLKRQRDEARQELEKNRWEYCETCEHAEHVDRLEAECDKLKRKEKQLSNELGLRDKAIEMLLDVKQELIAERDNLAADLQDCERQRERLRQALGEAIDHAHEVVSLVTLDGEVIG